MLVLATWQIYKNGNRTESQRIKSKWIKSQKIIPKKVRKKESQKIVYCKYICRKKVMTFFPMLLILVTGRFHLQKSREIKPEFSVCVHYTNFLGLFFHWLFIPWLFIPWLFYQRHYFQLYFIGNHIMISGKKSQGKKIILTLFP